jgi:hypothetical protein
MSTPSRRRKPRTKIGRLVRHWPKIRLAIRVARLVMRARVAIEVAIVTGIALWLHRAHRRRRQPRRGSEPLTRYAPPPVRHTAPAPDPPVDAEAPTETERRLRAET